MYRLSSNPSYFLTDLSANLTAVSDKGYFFTLATHPVTNQSTIGQVYTRDLATNELFIQHFLVAPNPIDTYQLKNHKRNLASKGHAKYACTTKTSAITQYQGCQLHDTQHLAEANRRARRNNRSSPTCIFKISAVNARLLPIKAHQLYQDITLL